ncbi:MAG TPA: DUF3793 family protein [Caproiciproducens sp.]|nr:DUF3793 family protein [Caproiciproducens sp.]
MTARQFDSMLARHCAPALAGIKSANMISVREEAAGHLARLLAIYNKPLGRHGVRVEILCRYRTHTLVLVYRPGLLWSQLQEENVQNFLASLGYCRWESLDSLLCQLKERCARHCIPHEIGLFLNYPLEDVIGFMEGGAPCKLCGYWKVYSDADFARMRFRQFTSCRETYCRLIESGGSVLHLFRA